MQILLGLFAPLLAVCLWGVVLVVSEVLHMDAFSELSIVQEDG